MPNKIFYKIVLTALLTLFIYQANAATGWQKLKPGLEYSELNPGGKNSWGRIHVFRIDPKRYHLALAFAKDHAMKVSSVKQLAKFDKALIAINGGFFTPKLEPIGLRIQNGIVRQGLKPVSWWGVLYSKYGQLKISSQRAFRLQKSIQFAIQGGPRLIVNGRIPRLKPGTAERTAVGLTRKHKIIILVTDNAPMSTTDLAILMRKRAKDNGLDCYNALNLDGGHSSQMYAKINDFIIDVTGYSAITDALLVLP